MARGFGLGGSGVVQQLFIILAGRVDADAGGGGLLALGWEFLLLRFSGGMLSFFFMEFCGIGATRTLVLLL